MKILGLDISTKTGIAIIEDGNLTHYELVTVKLASSESQIDDFNHIDRATEMANRLLDVVKKHDPDFIYIEQTNLGNNRTAQKLLEFTHCLVLMTLREYATKIAYVDSSAWRNSIGLQLTKEDRKHNKEVKKNLEQGVRAGPGKGKKTSKHLAVRWVNEKFNLDLKIKDNDLADAICLAYYGHLYRQKPAVEVNLSAIDSLF